jgi:hypothetical protein
MRPICHKCILIGFSALAAAAQNSVAQNSVAQNSVAQNSYDPRLTFAPLTLPNAVNSYRSSNGAPGPAYWQNEADYEMHAEIDPAAKTLKNNETITYTNNSPDVAAAAGVGAAAVEVLPLWRLRRRKRPPMASSSTRLKPRGLTGRP